MIRKKMLHGLVPIGDYDISLRILKAILKWDIVIKLYDNSLLLFLFVQKIR